jgi:hypothetical protein
MPYYKTLYASDFIDNGDGTHTATILASTHGMGAGYNCTRCLKHKSSSNFFNVVASYQIAANGDFTLTVNEPATFRVGLEEVATAANSLSINEVEGVTV